MRRGHVALAALCASTALAAASIAIVVRPDAHASRPSPQSEPAESLYRSGLDHELRLEYAAAYRAYRDALEVDPEFLPALVEMVAMLGDPFPEFLLRFVDSLASRQREPGLRSCVDDLKVGLRGRFTPLVTRGSFSPTAWACREFLRYQIGSWPSAITRASLRRLLPYRDVPMTSRWVMDAAHSTGTAAEVLQFIREFQRGESHPLSRASAYGFEANWHHNRGDHDRALAAEARARSDPAWSLGGFRARYFVFALGHDVILGAGIRPLPDAIAKHATSALEEAEIGWRRASHEGDQLARLVEGVTMANRLLDRGKLNEAVDEWRSLNTTADSVGDPAIRARFLMRLGRSLVKTGRFAEAEQHLLASRALQATGGSVATHKETEHNLLHLYEALGMDAEARRAGEQFVSFAAMAGLHAVRMMSARDFGRFLRARGEIEESRRLFTRMLADIDSLRDNWIWAGEYYELNGELDLARRYYLRGLENGGGHEGVRLLEGLVRISLMASDSTSAIKYAAAHDQRRTWYGVPESAPLLPGVLRQLGRSAEARSQLESARELVRGTGQIAAHAALTLELAELELSHGNYLRARLFADSAADVARRMAITDLSVRANALAALATLRAGGTSIRNRRVLDDAVRDADLLGHAQLRVETRRRRAEGVALTGNWREALRHYAAAAAVSDSMAQTIALDPQQASFRAAQRAVYDGAMGSILAHADESDAAARFVDWSRRRKSRGYGASSGVGDFAARGLPRVPKGHALIDYVVLDTSVAALVVTSARATLVTLPVESDSLRALVRRFHASMATRVGSAIDLSRASFPLGVAHQLYGQLIGPLERLLGDAREVTIVPDGPLFLVPFDGLVTVLPPRGSERPYAEAQYVVDRYVVTETVSADGAVPTLQLPAGKFVAVAPVVDGALGEESGREVDAIERIVPSAARATLRGAAATERAVRDVAARTAILHFAAHATVNHHDPGSSRLALSPGDGDDGALHSDEIAQLRLPGNLVVLSACETAAGRVLDGEGVLSLSRTFLRAGATATVATLWPVGPRSADFMAAFYDSLLRGSSPASALRDAKLAMRRAGIPPVVWAPYTLIARGAKP